MIDFFGRIFIFNEFLQEKELFIAYDQKIKNKMNFIKKNKMGIIKK